MEPSASAVTSPPNVRTSNHDQPASAPASTPNSRDSSVSKSSQKHQNQQPLQVVLPPAPSTPTLNSDATLTPPPRSPGAVSLGNTHVDGNCSDKSSETATGARISTTNTPSGLSRKESYKAQRQHYRREKARVTSALLHSLDDPSVILLSDWLKVRGSLKSWTKLWCVLKPGLLLLYKSSKAKSSHWVGTVLLTSCQVIERPSKKDGFCFKLYHPLEQSIWAPRGPHNETIGAVVQPLPTAHLIFRAPSPAAGHCWLDGLELALKCTNSMLRCSRVGGAAYASEDAAVDNTPALDHEDLEKHFSDHELEDGVGLSDSDSDMSAGGAELPGEVPTDCCASKRVEELLEKFNTFYELDTNDDVGAAGELVEEIAEENKSLLWFLIKQVRPGMDLSKVVLPTFILEPRSFLDKLSDNFYHADILARAAHAEDPYTRFKAVLKWYLSGLYKKPRGLKKPYNPVLGEVFRCFWHHPDTGSRTFYVAEQVSHHPPISAFYASNRKEGFVIEGSFVCKSKFYGNSTSAILDGLARIILTDRAETYYTSAPYAHCKGLVVGTLSMELGGKVIVSCPSTGYKAEIEFKLKSFLGGSDQTNAVYGRVRKGKDLVATIEGYWDGRIDLKEKRSGDEIVLVDCNSLKTKRLKRYLVKLEHQRENESAKQWIKVSQAIMNDNQIAATEEKTIIEEAQREKVRSGQAVEMILFKKRSDSGSSLHDRPTVTESTDNGWRYIHFNPTPWHPEEEIMEYECNFLIKSLSKSDQPIKIPSLEDMPTHSDFRAAETLMQEHYSEDSGRDEAKISRHMKKSLHAIDAAIREQTRAIDKLARCVEAMGENQRQFRPLNLGRVPQATHAFDIFAGFVMAFILQALINWIFIQKW